jgi:ubiquinone/menaquinone biosynthesis C-methylase UbiE
MLITTTEAVDRPMARHEYKEVWTRLAETPQQAKQSVMGNVTEDEVQASAQGVLQLLQDTVRVDPSDVIVEIGCGIGRVGQAVAPHCRRWIGCDVSPNMLELARQRMVACDNAAFVEVSGFDLQPIEDASADVVYCTVVFMHLDEWDRYSYVLEAHRVLRPGGRIYVDNFNLCSDDGWEVFEKHRRHYPRVRPAHIGKASTPQEIETYLRRAGFRDVRVREVGTWVQGYAIK